MTITERTHKLWSRFIRDTGENPNTIIMGTEEYLEVFAEANLRMRFIADTKQVLSRYRGMDVVISIERSVLMVGVFKKEEAEQ